MLSTEAIQAVQSLKLSKLNPSKLEQVMGSRLSRLLKADLLDALAELQRQNEVELALKVRVLPFGHHLCVCFFCIFAPCLENS